MPKVAVDRLTEAEEKALKREFKKTMEILDKEKNLQEFFLQALTPSEVVMLARRIQIAKFLIRGFSYIAIERKLHVGQKTIESVHRWLSSYREYRKDLPKALDQVKSRKGYVPADPYSFRWLRKKYPLHFLLINLLLDE